MERQCQGLIPSSGGSQGFLVESIPVCKVGLELHNLLSAGGKTCYVKNVCQHVDKVSIFNFFCVLERIKIVISAFF